MFRTPVYYGWVLVPLTIVLLTCLVGITASSFGLFVLPVSRDLNLSRAEVNSVIILLSLGFAISSPVVGYMLDRVSIRRLMMVSAAIFGGSLVALAHSTSMWLSAAIILLPLSFSYMGGGALVSPALMARWFTVYRGRAMALSALGLSAASVVIAPIVAVSIDAFGWRHTLELAGFVIGSIIFIVALFVRNAPGPDDHEVHAEAYTGGTTAPVRAPLGSPRPASELARLPSLWVIGFVIGMSAAVGKAVVVSLVPIAQANGVSTAQAATLIAAVGAVGVSTKLVLAWFADRVDRIVLLSILLTLLGLTNVVLSFSEAYPVLLFASAMIGFAGAAFTPVSYALLADRFGPSSFGTSKGLITPLSTVMGAISVRYAGEVYDRTGDYALFFQSGALGLFLAAAIMLRLRFVKVAATVTAEESARVHSIPPRA